MFEGPVTGNIPEVLDNGEVTDGTHVTAGQLALALTPYAQVTDLAVNTAASGNNAAAIQSLDDRVTAELASKLDSSALAPAIAPLATAAALATTDGQGARKQHRSAAELADHGSLQQGRPVGLRRAGGRGGHEEHPGRRGPEAVQLQHHGGHERIHRLGQQRHAGHGGGQLRPQDGGGPALPRHSGEDHAAGGRHQGGQRSPGSRVRRSAGLRARKQRRLHRGAASEVDSKIAALDAALLGKADASALAFLLSTVDGLDTPLEVDTKIANALLGLATEAFVAAQLASRDASITALQGAKADATLLASYATNAALSASETTLQSALDAILAELAALQLSGSGGVVNAPAWAGFTTWELVRGSNVVRNLHLEAPLSAALANGEDTLSITADCYSVAAADAALAAALLAYYTSSQVDALLGDYRTGAAQDAETTGAISAALLAYYTSSQVDALLGDYRTASAQDTQTQAAIAGALLAHRTGPDQDVFTTNQIASALVAYRSAAGQWSDHFEQTASAYNARPHETVHGAPEDVEKQPATEFRVLQDNADRFQNNKDLTNRRIKAVEDAGAFRAPTNAARSFNPQYGDVQQLRAVDSMTVQSTEGRETLLKLALPAPQGSGNVVGRLTRRGPRTLD